MSPAPDLGFRIGHATHPSARTGCTVVLCPDGTVGAADVRGPAPGTRETALLSSDKRIERVDAVLLTGGSAFGLAAADGVMRFLGERGVGHPTPVKPIPIVAAAVIYDLLLAGAAAYPDADLGYAACVAAQPLPLPAAARGRIGAGSGATVGKWGGYERMMTGGVGYAEREAGGARVAVIAVVNAIGDVVAANGRVLSGARAADGTWLVRRVPERWVARPALTEPPRSQVQPAQVRPPQTQPPQMKAAPAAAQSPATRWQPRTPSLAQSAGGRAAELAGSNTTLVAVLTDAAMTKPAAARLAQRAHDGIARAVVPAHTEHDGDTTFALASGSREAPVDLVAAVAVACVSAAIRDAVRGAVAVSRSDGAASA